VRPCLKTQTKTKQAECSGSHSATYAEEIGRIEVQDQSRQKVSETLILTNKPGMVVHIAVPAMWEVWRIMG
jgi:hypothetical protein